MKVGEEVIVGPHEITYRVGSMERTVYDSRSHLDHRLELLWTTPRYLGNDIRSATFEVCWTCGVVLDEVRM